MAPLSKYSDDLKKVLSQCSSNKLITAFFSDENIAVLQTRLRQAVKANLGLVISRQSDQEMVQVMRAMYSMHGNPRPSDVRQEVNRLNGIVLDYVVPHVTTNVRAHMGYLRDISRPYRLLDRPSYASLKGEQTVQLFPSRGV